MLITTFQSKHKFPDCWCSRDHSGFSGQRESRELPGVSGVRRNYLNDPVVPRGPVVEFFG